MPRRPHRRRQFMVMKTSLVAGSFCLICSPASRPFSLGMDMSRMITSGLWVSADLTRLRPSVTMSMTWNSGSSRLLQASASSLWSSAIKRRAAGLRSIL